jgi:hypothetical protein
VFSIVAPFSARRATALFSVRLDLGAVLLQVEANVAKLSAVNHDFLVRSVPFGAVHLTLHLVILAFFDFLDKPAYFFNGSLRPIPAKRVGRI